MLGRDVAAGKCHYGREGLDGGGSRDARAADVSAVKPIIIFISRCIPCDCSLFAYYSSFVVIYFDT